MVCFEESNFAIEIWVVAENMTAKVLEGQKTSLYNEYREVPMKPIDWHINAEKKKGWTVQYFVEHFKGKNPFFSVVDVWAFPVNAPGSAVFDYHLSKKIKLNHNNEH